MKMSDIELVVQKYPEIPSAFDFIMLWILFLLKDSYSILIVEFVYLVWDGPLKEFCKMVKLLEPPTRLLHWRQIYNIIIKCDVDE